MKNDWEYRDVRSDDVGQKVEVYTNYGWRLRTLLAVLPDYVSTPIVYLSDNTEEKEPMFAQKACIRKTYEERQKQSGFKIGDIVKVVRKAESKEDGWQCSWVKNMDEAVGYTFEVVAEKNVGFLLKNPKINFCQPFYFPYFVLEKIKPIEEYIGKLVRINSTKESCILEHTYSFNSEKFAIVNIYDNRIVLLTTEISPV